MVINQRVFLLAVLSLPVGFLWLDLVVADYSPESPSPIIIEQKTNPKIPVNYSQVTLASERNKLLKDYVSKDKLEALLQSAVTTIFSQKGFANLGTWDDFYHGHLLCSQGSSHDVKAILYHTQEHASVLSFIQAPDGIPYGFSDRLGRNWFQRVSTGRVSNARGLRYLEKVDNFFDCHYTIPSSLLDQMKLFEPMEECGAFFFTQTSCPQNYESGGTKSNLFRLDFPDRHRECIALGVEPGVPDWAYIVTEDQYEGFLPATADSPLGYQNFLNHEEQCARDGNTWWR